MHIDVKNYGGRNLIEKIVKNYYSKLDNIRPNTPHFMLTQPKNNFLERKPLKLEYTQSSKNRMMMATYYTIFNMKRGLIDTSAPKTYHMSRNLRISKKVNNYRNTEHCKNWNNMQKRINQIGSVYL